MVTTRSKKRVRDYHAEYTRRLAKGRAAGLSRQQARGHREKEIHGRTEAGYRRHRSRLKYGASPEVLRRLRNQVLSHVLGQLAAVKTAQSPKVETIRKGLLMLHVEELNNMLDLTGRDIKAIAGTGQSNTFNDEEFWRSLDFNYLADEIEEGRPLNRNPLWYH